MTEENYRPNVMISYAAWGTDLESACILRDALQKNEVHVPAWRDKEDIAPGTKGILAIQRGITESQYFVQLMSPRTIASKWCGRERSRADRLKKRIIPVILEKVPDDDWPLELEDLQWIDARTGIGNAVQPLLKEIGVTVKDAGVPPDALARDNRLIEQFAHIAYYFDSEGEAKVHWTQRILVGQNLAKIVETDRARNVIRIGTPPRAPGAGTPVETGWSSGFPGSGEPRPQPRSSSNDRSK